MIKHIHWVKRADGKDELVCHDGNRELLKVLYTGEKKPIIFILFSWRGKLILTGHDFVLEGKYAKKNVQVEFLSKDVLLLIGR